MSFQKMKMMDASWILETHCVEKTCSLLFCFCFFVFLQGHYRLLSGYPGYALQVPLGFGNSKVGKL